MRKALDYAVSRVAPVSQPLVFETGLTEAPYSQAGTAFLIGRGRKARVVTCRHTIRPDNLFPVCVFPVDGERRFLPLTNVHFVPLEAASDDYADIAIVDIDLRAIRHPAQGQARLINLDLPGPDWKEHRYTSPFVVLGYPADRSYIDYEDCLIHSERIALYGSYLRPTPSAHVHSLKIDETKGLSSLRGFSGGPVLSWVYGIGIPPTLVLAGMAIQGSVESGMIHFIESSVIIDAADVWS